MSRASIYRWFPGGRDEVIQAAVGWEVDNFFVRLGAKLGEQPDFPSYLELALPQARHDLLDHDLLHRMLATEPEQVSTLLAFQQHHMVELVGLAFRPRLAVTTPPGSCAPASTPRPRPTTWPAWPCRCSPSRVVTISTTPPRSAASSATSSWAGSTADPLASA